MLVLLVDVGLLPRQVERDRRRMVSAGCRCAGVVFSLVVALLAAPGPVQRLRRGLSAQFHRACEPGAVADPYLLFGTISGDLLTELFNPLYVILLGLVVGMSMAWSFTEDWGEYFALLFWSTVGMMLLTAAEELLDALPDARDDDDLPLPLHGVREDAAALGRGGAEVLRLRLGLVGPLPVRPEPDLRPDREHAVRRDLAGAASAGAGAT